MNYFNYFSEIEELFVRRRGRNLLLSPLDWALIETWQERAVPLHIILSGIEKVFDSVDQQPLPRRRTVKSLLYCKEEIEAQFAEWQERQVGSSRVQSSKFKVQSSEIEGQNSENKGQSSDGEAVEPPKNSLFSGDAMAQHLERVLLEINVARRGATGDFQQTLAVVAERLTMLGAQTPHAAENLEESLEKLDALLDRSLRQHFETAPLKSEVEKQIASHKSKMEPEVYQRTFDLMLLKRLRENADLPRLSLFYL